ncbi:hypothetical protein V6N12_050197 [Hibiscus sabdariffa]|uniref:Reverse transcriptase zinc-binding domain-containing protein n=1 Tax=Hibiscus sabdariffa TaxID=183260 RepID=A0ABR2GCM1_9ROSI
MHGYKLEGDLVAKLVAMYTCFLWLVMHQRILTNVERERRHLSSVRLCQLCRNEDEDTDHILCRCPRAYSTWFRLVSLDKRDDFVTANLQEWMVANLKTPNRYGINDDKWPIRFVVVYLQLWKRRCSLLLDDKFVEKKDFLTQCGRLMRSLATVRSCSSSCVRSMKRCFTFGILDIRKQWWNRTRLYMVNSLVFSIGQLLAREWDVISRHIGRMANNVTDGLARICRGAPVGTMLFQEPQLVVVVALSKD